MALIVQIVSAASTGGERYFVNLGGGQVQVNQNIILWGWSDIQWNDCWEMTPEGMLVCVADPQLVIGIDGDNNVITVQRNESDSTQCWTIARLPVSAACTIQNKSTSQYLTVPGSSSQGIYGGPQLVTDGLSDSGVPGGQDWLIVPAQIQPAAQQFYIRSKTTGNSTIDSGTPYVLAAPGSSAGDDVVIDSWQPFASSQLWTLNGDGTISSGYGSSLVLTTSGTQDTDVTIDTLGAANTVQTWIVGDQGNDDYKDLIYVKIPDGTLNLNLGDKKLTSNQNVLAYYEQPYASNDFWELIPAQPVPVGTWFSLRVDESVEGSPYVLTAASGTIGAGVTIEPFQPGAPNQLWLMQADGVIVSALDRNLALTANGSSDNQVALQTVQSGTPAPLQQWYVQGDGIVVVNYGGKTGLQYLNVRGGGPAVPGQTVITFGGPSGAPNETWTILPYQPDPSGQWFTIRSATVPPGDEMPYLLTAWPTGQVLSMPPQDRMIVGGGVPGINQLWRMTMQGAIVSAVNPNLALTGNDSGDVSLAPWNGSTDQQWAWGASAALQSTIGQDEDIRCGVLQNLGQPDEVLFAGPADTFHQPITLQSEKGYSAAGSLQNYPGAFWYVVPFLPAFDQWTTIRSLAADGLFLNLPVQPTKDVGYQATVGPQNSSLSTWQFAWPGYIVSATNPEIVLSVWWDETTTTFNVVAYPRQPGPQPFQLWTAMPDGALVNRKNGQAMTVSGTAPGSTVITTTLSGSPTKTQQWEFSPGTVLQTVLAQPPAPYPEAATQGETKAYTYINQSLGLSPDRLRAQYANLAAPLASYQSRLNALPPPPPSDDVSTSEWTDVVGQLNDELTAVIAVQTLFQQVTALYLELSQAQAMALSEAVTAAELPDGMQTTVKPKKKGKWGWLTEIVEGLVYTGLNVAGGIYGDPNAGKQLFSLTNGLPCIANMFETGFNAGQSKLTYDASAKGSRAAASKLQTVLKNIYNYELSVLQMQQTLLSVFQASGSALGEIETLILTDWGKLQAVYRMIRTPGGISSLYWPSTMTPMLADQMLPGYTTGVLQALMPANADFNITATLHIEAIPKQPTGLSPDGTQFVEDNEDGTQNAYTTSANQEVMAMVWGNGTDPADFFRGVNGWELPVVYQIVSGTPLTLFENVSADIVISMQNFTDQELHLVIDCYGLLGQISSLNSGSKANCKVIIPAYGVSAFAGTAYYFYDTQLGVDVRIAMSGTFAVTDGNKRPVVSGTITSSVSAEGSDPAKYSWTISAKNPPYRSSVEQVPVNPSSMYMLNIGIYDLGG